MNMSFLLLILCQLYGFPCFLLFASDQIAYVTLIIPCYSPQTLRSTPLEKEKLIRKKEGTKRKSKQTGPKGCPGGRIH